MKRLIYNAVFFGFAVLVLISIFTCNVSGTKPCEDTIGGFKEISTNLNEGAVTIKVLCVMANLCGNFKRLEYSVDGNAITVHFYSHYEGVVCAQMLKEEEHTLIITGLFPGTYTIKPSTGYYYNFYTQWGWSETITIILN